MMCLTQTTSYAVQALACLDDPTCHPRLVRDIALCTGIPKPYLAKTINQLAHKGLVLSKRGYRGGIFLARSLRDISLLEIVEAIEGPQWIGDCLLGLEVNASEDDCPTRAAWKRIRKEIEDLLRRTTVADMINCPRPTRHVRAPSRECCATTE